MIPVRCAVTIVLMQRSPFSQPYSGCWAIAGNTFWKSWERLLDVGPAAFWKNRVENMQNSWKKDKQMLLEKMVIFLCQQISA